MSLATTRGYEAYLDSLYGGRMQKVEAARRLEEDKNTREKLYATLLVKGGDIASKFQKDYMSKKFTGKDPMVMRIGGDKGFDIPMNLPRGTETKSSGWKESFRRSLYSKPADYTKADYGTAGTAVREAGSQYVPSKTPPGGGAQTSLLGPSSRSFTGGLNPEELDKILKQYGNFAYSGGTDTASVGMNAIGQAPSVYVPTGVGGGSGTGLLSSVSKFAEPDYLNKAIPIATDISTTVGETAPAWANAIPYASSIFNAAMIPFQGNDEGRAAQTMQTGGSLLTTYILANIDKIAAMVVGLSDRRLKENINLVGQSGKGLNIYQWNYKGVPDKKYEGVMADEVPKEARVIFEGGLQAVDYSKVDVDMRRVY